MHIPDLDTRWDPDAAAQLLSRRQLVELDQEHPGFRDADYRARRDRIARVAFDYREGPVPEVEYTEEEHAVWRVIWAELEARHTARASSAFLDTCGDLDLPKDRIPQLEWVSARLQAHSGFRLAPVAGLVHPRVFMGHLGEGVFLSTQYIRHHSAPLYTPEPDVVHELIGHGATLIHPGIAQVSKRFGQVAQMADAELLTALTRVYWYTLEFGLVEEGGEVKAFGAGVLSSVGEMDRAPRAPHRAWDIDEMARTDFDPTMYQPFYYVGPGVDQMLSDLNEWLDSQAAT
ncbi:MAG: phenylalanine 4-monooxygenase [Bradymonadia bacterium]